MVMSTPESSYDANDATTMLELLGENTVELAVKCMEESLILKKSKGDRNSSVRKYAYSDL
jgi:hypothetical protein